MLRSSCDACCARCACLAAAAHHFAAWHPMHFTRAAWVCLHEHTSQTCHVQVGCEQASAHQALVAATVLTMWAPSEAAAGGLRADIRQPGAGILQRHPRLPHLPPVSVSFKLPPLQHSLAICLHLSHTCTGDLPPLEIRWLAICLRVLRLPPAQDGIVVFWAVLALRLVCMAAG